MSQRQQNLRYAAAKAFMESLDQLQETLQATDKQSAQPPTASTNGKPSQADVPPPETFDLNSFDQAVADIEAFIQRQHNEAIEAGDESKG